MDLLAVSYNNIGPFFKKKININFVKGKFVIKSNIGVGKSFLFFDGPLYGLYKYCPRNILNIKSKSGYIKLFFELNGEYYLIVRTLKKGKNNKPLCNSRFFQIFNFDYNKLENNIFVNHDIEYFLKSNSKIEEIKFKNEIDLQKGLNEILPPRQVFVTTIFLLQDSNNIFDMQASERISIFKNIFNLLDIDVWKDKINETKKIISTKIKIYQDNTNFDDKLRKLTKNYLDIFYKLLEDKDINNILNEEKQYFDDLKNIEDKIGIGNFELNKNIINKINLIKEYVNDKKSLFHSQNQNIKNLKDENQNIENDLKNNIKNINSKEKKILEYENEIKKYDKNKQLELENNLKNINLQIQEINQEYDIKNIFEKYKKLDFEENFENNINGLYNCVVYIKNKGIFLGEKIKSLNEKIDNYNFKLKSLEDKKKQLKIEKGTNSYDLLLDKVNNKKNELINLKNNKDQEIKNLNEKIEIFKNQISKFQKNIEEINNEDQEKSKFNCQKINGLCPFIKQINSSFFESLINKKKEYQKEIDEYNIKINNLKNNTKNIYEEIEKIKSKLDFINIDNQDIFKDFYEKINQENKKIEDEIISINKIFDKKEIDKEIRKNKSRIEDIKNFLNNIKWKNIEEIYKKYNQLQNKKELFQNEINKLQNKKIEIDKFIISKEKLQTEIEGLKADNKGKTDKQKQISEKLKIQEAKITDIKIEEINNIENNINDLFNKYNDISNLLEDFQEQTIKLKKLKEDEKIYQNLYNIFSKELLLLVLEDSLPTLNDTINNFLDKLVDFQIKMYIKKIKSDKLELEVEIFDNKGIRDVSSLSGGQRIILKLVWMLSIVVFTNSQMLFLDETINNLDFESIGKVSDLLSDFIKQNNIKFYTITHSQQILDMEIWDNVIDLKYFIN